MTDNFSGYPKSVTEFKSDKTNRANDWTPRDALIEVLRDIDEGHLILDAVVIIVRRKSSEPDKVGNVGWSTSSPDYHTGIGMVASALHRMQTLYD